MMMGEETKEWRKRVEIRGEKKGRRRGQGHGRRGEGERRGGRKEKGGSDERKE